MPELDAAVLDAIFTTFALPPINLTSAASPYSVEELIRAFTRQRSELIAVISNLDDAQINFSPAPESFSISEIVSHITTAQNGPYNALLELSNIVLPFVDHVRFMPGEGARKQLSAAACQHMLNEATEELSDLMRQAARIDNNDTPKEYPILGSMTLKAWMLFQLGHDVDHLRQAKAVLSSEGFPHHVEVVNLT